MRPGCPVSSPDSRVNDVDTTTVLLDQPFASLEMGDSMDSDLLPELSGETWMAATLLEETYSRFATGWIKSGPYCGISAGCNFDNCS